MLKSFKVLPLTTLLFVAQPSIAAEKLFLTGAEVTDASTIYLYMGAAIPFSGSSLAKGVVLHLWADYQTYSYASGVTNIDANVNSISAAIAYHDSGIDHWWNVGLGLARSDTSLSPNDPGNDAVGLDSYLKFQLEGERHLSEDFKLSGNFSYIVDRSSYWMRGRFLNRNDDNTYHGPELIFQGDDTYSAYQLGWVLTEMLIGGDWSMGLKGGFRVDDVDTAIYAGIELSTPY